jgi:hypothetical protein
MRTLLITLAFVLAAVFCAQAEVQKTNDKMADGLLGQAAISKVLTFADPSLQPPTIRPRLAAIKRSYVPSADNLITKFLGGRQTLIGNGESIVSPIWGKGTRYKSGTVIYALPLSQKGQKVQDLRSLPKLESVPAFLDVYPNGFLYTNNVSHKAVNMPAPKVEAQVLKPNNHNLYSPKDGQSAVEQMLPGMVGDLKVPKGFRKSLSHMVQNYGERLYAYHLTPEYVTTYPVYGGKDGKSVVAEKPIAVPILDSYVHVLLDGDKVLAGMEYFWDNGLSVQGSPKPCLSGQEATIKAMAWLIKRYNENPPLYTVSNIRLGYIQNPKNHGELIPAWIFDAWYITPLASSVGTTENPIKRTDDTFAVNALSGEAFDLTSLQ